MSTLTKMGVELYNLISNVLRSYSNEISPYEAFVDEIAQNFFDSAKKYYRYCVKENVKPINSSMKVLFIEDYNGKPAIVIKQTGTTGIIHRKEYVTYSLTQKDKDEDAAGSQGVGWKIWFMICDEVHTETIVDGRYYQTLQRVENRDIKVAHNDDNWSTYFEHFQDTLISENGETSIKFLNVNNSHGFNEDESTTYFQELWKCCEKVIQERYYWALKKYPTFSVDLIYTNSKKTQPSQKVTISLNEYPPLYPGLNDSDCRTSNKFIRNKTKNYGVVKDIFVGFTNEIHSKINDGVAIIVRDRVVEWYNPRSQWVGTPGANGKLIGHVCCDFLYKKDNMTHDKLNDIFPEVKLTRHFIRTLIQKLYVKINELHVVDVPKVSHGNTILTTINNAIAEFIDSEDLFSEAKSDIDYEPLGEEPFNKTPKPEKFIYIKGILLTEKIEDGIPQKMNDTDPLTPSNEYSALVEILNTKDECEAIVNYSSFPKYFEIKRAIKISPGTTKDIFKFQIPEDAMRGAFHLKSIVRSQDEKLLEKRIISREILPIISKVELSERNFERGNEYQISYKVCRSSLRGNREFSCKIYDNENFEIHEEGPITLKRAETDKIESFYFKIPPQALRGRYTFEYQVKNGPNIIQKGREYFFVELFINRIKSSKRIVKYNEKFDITVDLENKRQIPVEDAELTIRIENSNHFEMKKEFTNISIQKNSDFAIKLGDLEFDEDCDTGKYSVIVEFKLEDDFAPEVKTTKIFLETETSTKDSKGALSHFDYNKSIKGYEDKNLAVSVEGTIMINTFHYLFRRIETPTGIDLNLFKQCIIQALWFAFRDQITKDNRFEEMWEFEKYILEDKKLGEIL
ncbi:MAG: hypothetical protein JW776_16830 [Candidatus Lokiarchaeota archaeon]|nr:hypothetical protein [Candidatus Lokiarchaeota archaeon]